MLLAIFIVCIVGVILQLAIEDRKLIIPILDDLKIHILEIIPLIIMVMIICYWSVLAISSLLVYIF